MHTTAIAEPSPSAESEAEPNVRAASTASKMATIFAAGFTTLGASLANYLVHQGYPLLSAEVALTFGGVAAICGLASLFYLGLGMSLRRVMEAALVALLVDINFADWQWSAAAGAIVLAALVAWGKSALPLISTFGAIVFAAVLAGSPFAEGTWIESVEHDLGSPSAAMRTGRPAIVHVVLDEHIGLGGFPRTYAGREAARDLSGFYTANGFQSWSHAYSRHMDTVNAIPDILNFGQGLALRADRTGMEVGDTAYFKRLRELGYRTTIYQSTFGDFCSGVRPARCVEYDMASPTPTMAVGLSTGQGASMLVTKFLALAQMLKPIEDCYDLLFRIVQFHGGGTMLPTPAKYLRVSTGVAALEAMNLLTVDLADTKPGEAIFVHSLMPHYPYVADRNCAIKPLETWLHRDHRRPIAERQSAYFEQVRCAKELVNRMIATLDKSPAAGNYVLILHGDHGSRVTRADPRAGRSRIAKEDFVAGFSTLFAVKFASREGSTEGRIEPGIVPVSELLRQLALTDFKALSFTHSQAEPSVFLADRDWRPREERAFPTGW